jgi:hypothetical protein
VGFESFGTDLPEDVSEEALLKVVQDYNADPAVHGILVQVRRLGGLGVLGGAPAPAAGPRGAAGRSVGLGSSCRHRARS